MVKKGSKLYSIVNNKCPKCQEGDFFVTKNPLKLNKNLAIHENCSSCGLKYMIEPSFFYGAMYVSYGITVALSIITFIILYSLGLELLQIFIGIIIALIIFTPLTLKLSRLIYINIFVHYKKDPKD
ncbi:DUF983 domain-containing protein [Namhaeicola litoreus]|uniref:DUF983 domain-containing protein n=1 Tax=Namhaeicola litoreus TaxID=1052145 RepID=A0ABW3Y1N9_9FLAO